jgi:hypothetical protein
MKGMLFAVLMLSSCGYSSVKNEMIGQVKKVVSNTPIICPNYTSVDVSLGVMRNGVGSMSTQDVWLTVVREEDVTILKQAAESGKLVKINYDELRFAFCIDDHVISSVSMTE